MMSSRDTRVLKPRYNPPRPQRQRRVMGATNRSEIASNGSHDSWGPNPAIYDPEVRPSPPRGPAPSRTPPTSLPPIQRTPRESQVIGGVDLRPPAGSRTTPRDFLTPRYVNVTGKQSSGTDVFGRRPAGPNVRMIQGRRPVRGAGDKHNLYESSLFERPQNETPWLENAAQHKGKSRFAHTDAHRGSGDVLNVTRGSALYSDERSRLSHNSMPTFAHSDKARKQAAQRAKFQRLQQHQAQFYGNVLGNEERAANAEAAKLRSIAQQRVRYLESVANQRGVFSG